MSETREMRTVDLNADAHANAYGNADDDAHADRCRLMTLNEAKATIAAKGWTNRALAQWWGCRPEHISRIIHDPGRKRHFDDALRGLPPAAAVRADSTR
jgi:hypothetical protein